MATAEESCLFDITFWWVWGYYSKKIWAGYGIPFTACTNVLRERTVKPCQKTTICSSKSLWKHENCYRGHLLEHCMSTYASVYGKHLQPFSFHSQFFDATFQSQFCERASGAYGGEAARQNSCQFVYFSTIPLTTGHF